jgi:uncharacterized protein
MPPLHTTSRPLAWASFLVAAALATSSSFAAALHDEVGGSIATNGNAELRVAPTRAAFTITVTTHAAGAAKASSDNAQASKTLIDAMTAAGLLKSELTGTRFQVSTHWTYKEHIGNVRDGFDAQNRIQVATNRLDSVGLFVDAVLNAGATDVSAVEFSAPDVSAARHQALASAVAVARADALAIAEAAGGTLGPLLSLGTAPEDNVTSAPRGMITVTASRALGASPQAPSPVLIPEDIVVEATVYGRWRFVPR